MGYKHPELLKLIPTDNSFFFRYVWERGAIVLNPKATDKTKLISLLRHELEHMNQAVKIYKSCGKKRSIEALSKVQKRQGYTTIALNEEFYKNMSKDANLLGFDKEKYYRAFSDYHLFAPSLEEQYRYFSNELENEAYSVQRKVQEILGDTSLIGPDGFLIKQFSASYTLLSQAVRLPLANNYQLFVRQSAV